MLHFDGRFGPKENFSAVDGRAKRHALFVDLPHLAQAEYLKATRVGEYGSVPTDEVVEVTMNINRLGAGAQHQVKSIAEENVGSRSTYLLGGQPLNRAVGPDRHKRRGGNLTAWKTHLAGARLAVGCGDVKTHVAHR